MSLAVQPATSETTPPISGLRRLAAGRAIRAWFVAAADQQSHLGIMAGPYPTAGEAGDRIAETRRRATAQGLLTSYAWLAVAEGPFGTPSYFGPV